MWKCPAWSQTYGRCSVNTRYGMDITVLVIIHASVSWKTKEVRHYSLGPQSQHTHCSEPGGPFHITNRTASSHIKWKSPLCSFLGPSVTRGSSSPIPNSSQLCGVLSSFCKNCMSQTLLPINIIQLLGESVWINKYLTSTSFSIISRHGRVGSGGLWGVSRCSNEKWTVSMW